MDIDIGGYTLDNEDGVTELRRLIMEFGEKIKVLVIDGIANLTLGDENDAKKGKP